MRTCYDSIDSTVTALPDGADLYAGYDDGHWPDAAAIASRFPDKTVLRVTVFATDNEGDVLDVERGDATPAEAPGWVQARRTAGHGGPLVYCSLNTWPLVRQAFTDAKVPEPGYWIAAYPGNGPQLYPGSVGHQYGQGPAGTNYDRSVFVDYLPGIDPAPKPTAPPTPIPQPQPAPPAPPAPQPAPAPPPAPPPPQPQEVTVDAPLLVQTPTQRYQVRYAVLQLQRLLDATGFPCGSPDGKFGPATAAAVRAFQRRAGIVVDGVVGRVTWGRLING